jgi:hypothetical protein
VSPQGWTRAISRATVFWIVQMSEMMSMRSGRGRDNAGGSDSVKLPEKRIACTRPIPKPTNDNMNKGDQDAKLSEDKK